MRFANIRELKLETNRILDLGRKNGPLVITRRGRPVALIRTITEDDFATGINPLWNRMRKAAERAGYGPQDVGRLIKQARVSK